MPRTYLPLGDDAFYQWALNFDGLVSANYAAYGLAIGVPSVYSAKLGVYQTTLAAAKGDATRGKSTVYAKNQAKKDLVTYTRMVAAQINRTMTVTNQQRTDLGLIVRKQPSPVPAPTARPTVTVSGVTMRTVNVRVFDGASATKRTKAPNAIGAKVYTFLGADYPTDPSLWAYYGDTTKDKLAIEFDNSVPSGAQVWVCAAWYNRKGQTGPVSVPVSTNIQGGGTNGAADLKIAA